MSVRNVSRGDVVDERVARAEGQAVRAVVGRAVVVADDQAAHRAVDVVVLRTRIVDRRVVAGVAEVGGRALEEEASSPTDEPFVR